VGGAWVGGGCNMVRVDHSGSGCGYLVVVALVSRWVGVGVGSKRWKTNEDEYCRRADRVWGLGPGNLCGISMGALGAYWVYVCM